jgi:hypothetical protein
LHLCQILSSTGLSRAAYLLSTMLSSFSRILSAVCVALPMYTSFHQYSTIVQPELILLEMNHILNNVPKTRRDEKNRTLTRRNTFDSISDWDTKITWFVEMRAPPNLIDWIHSAQNWLTFQHLNTSLAEIPSRKNLIRWDWDLESVWLAETSAPPNLIDWTSSILLNDRLKLEPIKIWLDEALVPQHVIGWIPISKHLIRWTLHPKIVSLAGLPARK